MAELSMKTVPAKPGVYSVVCRKGKNTMLLALEWSPSHGWHEAGHPKATVKQKNLIVLGHIKTPINEDTEAEPEPDPLTLPEKTEDALLRLSIERFKGHGWYKNEQPFDALVRRGLAVKNSLGWVLTKKGLTERYAKIEPESGKPCTLPACHKRQTFQIGDCITWEYSRLKETLRRFGVVVGIVPPHASGPQIAYDLSKQQKELTNLVQFPDFFADSEFRHGVSFICASRHGMTQKSKLALYWPRKVEAFNKADNIKAYAGWIDSPAFRIYLESS